MLRIGEGVPRCFRVLNHDAAVTVIVVDQGKGPGAKVVKELLLGSQVIVKGQVVVE